MAVYQHSRYSFCEAREDSEGRQFLTDRAQFRFKALADSRVHVVSQGDTLWAIAGRYFQPLPRPAGLWWVIADFQPNPIHDPTIQLVPGSVIIVPSVRTVLEEVLNERRRR